MPEANISGLGNPAPDEPFSSSSGTPAILGTNQLQGIVDHFGQIVDKLGALYDKACGSADASGLPGIKGSPASSNAGGPSFAQASAPGGGIYSAAQPQPGQVGTRAPGLNMWSAGGNGQGFMGQASFGGQPGAPGVTVPAPGNGGIPGGQAVGAFAGNAFAAAGVSKLGTQVAFSNYLQQAYTFSGGQPGGTGLNNRMLAQALGRPGAWNTVATGPGDALSGTAVMQQAAGRWNLTGPGSTPLSRTMQGDAMGMGYATGSSMTESGSLSTWLNSPMTSYRMMMMGFPVQPRQPYGQGPNQGFGNVLAGINKYSFGKDTVDPRKAQSFYSTYGAGYQELLGLTGGDQEMASQLAKTSVDMNNAVFNSKKNTGKQLDWNQVQGLLDKAATGDKGARSTLDKLGISETLQQRLKDTTAGKTGGSAELFNSFQSGLTTSTAALNAFTNVINGILKLPGVNQLVGGAGGVSAVGGPAGALLNTAKDYATGNLAGALKSGLSMIPGISNIIGVPGGGSSGSGNKSLSSSAGSIPQAPKRAGSGITDQAKTAVADAQSQLGLPYLWGAENPGGSFDCSGLTQWSYKQAGVDIPRTATAQWDYLSGRRRAVALDKVQEGDLIFKAGSGGSAGSPGHVAMMISNNAFIEAEMCVPADNTEILVRRGWVRFNEILEGDETLGFDHDSKTLQWTPINGVAVYPDSEVVTMGTKRWKAECTPNHKWVTKKKNNNKWLSDTELTPLNLTCSSHQILLSAPADTKEVLPISDVDAEILGWIIGDGTIRNRSESWVEVTITQAKLVGVSRIRELLVNVPHTESVRYPKRNKPCLPQSIFYLRAVYAHALLNAIGYHDKLDDLSSVILAMSPSQRAAFLRGIDGAEGEHTRKNSTLTVSQNNGPVQDAIVLCMYLLGYRPSLQAEHLGDMSNVPNRTITATIPRLHIVAGQFNIVHSRRTQTWCPLTVLGSWTMRQNGNVCVTGNTGVPIHDRPYRPGDWQHAGRPTGSTAGSAQGGVSSSGPGSSGSGTGTPASSTSGGPNISGMSAGGSPSSTSEADNVAAGLAGGVSGGTGTGGTTNPAAADPSSSGSSGSSPGTSGSPGGTGGIHGGGTKAQNKALMKRLAAAYGWGSGSQWAALDALEMSEAGYDNLIWNGQGSGAYGIAQALPASKYPKAGQPPSMGGHSDPKAQELWMLDYIKGSGNFHDPISAWAFHRSHNWYSAGTNSAKAGAAVLGERGPEIALLSGGQKIFDAKQTQEMLQSAKRPAQMPWKAASGQGPGDSCGHSVQLTFAAGSIVIGGGDAAGTRWDTSNSAREFARKLKKVLEAEDLYDAIASGQKAS